MIRSVHQILDGFVDRDRRGAELDRSDILVGMFPEGSRIFAHRFTDRGDETSAMFGIAYLTKANIAVTGQPLDCCSPILEGYRSPYDATVTAKLRAAGLTCLGSTNMDEFAMGSSGETSSRGAPRHPWLRDRVCGGSSSGSASAVAHGLVPFALGSDTGGSVRQPAAFCGLVGLKPTWGRVSRYGLVAHASSLDTIGVLATTAADAALVLSVIEGEDGRDSTLRAWPRPVWPEPPSRVAVPELEDGSVSESVAENFRRVVDELEAGGREVERVRLPSLGDALGAYVVLAAAETASNLARYDGSLYGVREERATYAESVGATRSQGFGTEVKLRILLGTEVLRQGHTARAIARARAVVARLQKEFEQAVPESAVCMLPTVPDVAFELGSRVDDALAMRTADRFTVVASLLGLPAVAVASGEDADAAPFSVQCIAHRGRDDLALGLAQLVEDRLDIVELRRRSWLARTCGGQA